MPNFDLSDRVFLDACGRFSTPFHLYDEAGIRRRIRSVRAAFAWAPEFIEYFAVKALPNPRILKIFREEGCGLDCSSLCEMRLADMAGVPGGRIMFSANAMPSSELTEAYDRGCCINLDDATDADTLIRLGRVPEEVCLRYNPGGELSVGSAIMGQPGESKYGMPVDQMLSTLLKLRAHGVKAFGVHALLASNCLAEDYYPLLSRELFALGRRLRDESGLAFSYVNLSGGVGIPYRPDDKAADIGVIGERIRKEYIDAFGPDPAGPGIRAEMGRYMTGPFGWLVTKVIHEKKIYKDYLGVDATAACLMRPAMYGAYHHIHCVGKRDLENTKVYDVTGALCENNDKFAVDRPLPEIEKGDILVIHDTGAHGLAMGYQYNGRLRCAEVLLREDGSFSLIRRAETPEDYFATLIPDDLL